MSTENSQLANASTEVTIGAQTLRIAMPSLAVEAEHELWLQKRYAEVAAAACGDDREKLAEVLDLTGDVGFYSLYARKLIRTSAGAERLLLTGLRKHHPEITLDKLRAIVGDNKPDFFKAVNAYLDLLYPPAKKEATPDPKDGSGSPPASGGSTTV